MSDTLTKALNAETGCLTEIAETATELLACKTTWEEKRIKERLAEQLKRLDELGSDTLAVSEREAREYEEFMQRHRERMASL